MIVRRQLARKMEFIAEDLSKLEEPGAGDLRAWFDKNQARFALPPRATFRRLLLARPPRAEHRADAAAALEALAGKPIDAPVAAATASCTRPTTATGRWTWWPRSSGRRSPARSPRRRPARGPGRWSPGYGWHLVFVDTMTPQRVPDFDAIEPEVKTAWIEDQREKTRARLYQQMRARYEVVLPQP